ncbi:MAG: DUF559 domain-containing protein [Pseudomonadota bacterium]
MVHRTPPPKHRQFAKDMRRDPTRAEWLLWQALRRKQLGSLKFKRQVPLDGCILDFVCFEKRLIIEADGWQHDDSAKDGRHDAHFRSHGFTTLRFTNDEIEDNLDAVL